MREVWKFIVYHNNGAVEMPVGSPILFVGSQDGRVVLWAGVDPTAPRVVRDFRLIATGEAFDPSGLNYVGTTQIGLYVWHVFEKLK